MGEGMEDRDRMQAGRTEAPTKTLGWGKDWKKSGRRYSPCQSRRLVDSGRGGRQKNTEKILPSGTNSYRNYIFKQFRVLVP